MTLGGRACVDDSGYENARAFFSMLEELGPGAAGLEERLDDLCAQPDPRANERCGLQLMTIHKAKGLGFDVVIVPGLDRPTRGEQQELLRWLEQTRLVGKAEHEFVVAPIGKNGQEGAIYRWIGKQKTERENEEAKRLLYVASTRARCELHLLGIASMKKDGEDLAKPRSGSLLKIAWPALEAEFRRAWKEREPAKAAPVQQQPELPFPPMIFLATAACELEAPGAHSRGRAGPGDSGNSRAASRVAGNARLWHGCACAVGGSHTGAGDRRGGRGTPGGGRRLAPARPGTASFRRLAAVRG